MTRAAYRILKVSLAIGIGFCVLVVDEQASLINQGLAGHAGRSSHWPPSHAMSYAGVARRTTRRPCMVRPPWGSRGGRLRAYAAPVVVAPTCYQAVDAYGRVYTRCP
jgi:hypothetical protein